MFSLIITVQLNGENIISTNLHKQLGVTFSKEAKCYGNVIDNIVSSASQHLNIIRKQKN